MQNTAESVMNRIMFEKTRTYQSNWGHGDIGKEEVVMIAKAYAKEVVEHIMTLQVTKNHDGTMIDHIAVNEFINNLP